MTEIESDERLDAPVRAKRSQPPARAEVSAMPDTTRLSEAIARLQETLETTARAQGRLPPVVSNRRGLPARLELWLKRLTKRATRWYTWEQVNFNSAVHQALNNVLAALSDHEQRLIEIEARLENVLSSDTSFAALLESVKARLSSLESFITDEVERLRAEQHRRLNLLLEEQRVSFKQLALEIKETGATSVRLEHLLDQRLREMAERLETLCAAQTEIEDLRRSLGVRQGQP